MNTIIEWLESHMLPCFYKSFLGIECPGCGMQRAIVELLKGDIWESLKVYPPLIPILFMLAFLITHLIFKFKNGAAYLKYFFIFTTSIILINYIYKLITH
jgi:hypothetical protein